MHPTVDLFLSNARVVHGAIADPATRDMWERPSVLEDQQVGGLAGHLARGAVWVVGDYLDAGVPSTPVAVGSSAEYFVTLMRAATDEFHQQIRARGADVASVGQETLVATLEERLAALEERLPALDAATPVTVAGGLVLRLDTYLETRIVEQVVHLDDLARSVGVERWPLGDDAYDLVLTIAVDVMRRQHGDPATLRAFFRRGFAADVLPVF